MNAILDLEKTVTMKDFNEKNDYLSQYYDEVTPVEFYSDIFPPDEIESGSDIYLRNAEGKPNPVISVKKYRFNDDGTPLMKELHSKDGVISYHAYYINKRIMFNDYNVVREAEQQDFAVCGLYTSWGKNKSSNHAFKLYGYAIDLDGVKVPQLNTLFLMVENDIVPMPTYIVNSGHGIHIYYVFERPVPLIPAYKRSLDRLKQGLTNLVWTRETSNYDPMDMQYQGIFQNFRMVGSHTKFGVGRKKTKYILRAFKTGNKVDLTYLNRFVEADPYTNCFAIRNLKKDFASLSDEHMTLDEAKELYPEWYHKRIELGLPKGRYICNRGLYTWWLNQIKTNKKVREGFRFYCVSILFVYAYKCDVPYEEVEQDAIDLIPLLNGVTFSEGNEFTIDDVIDASQMYDEKWLNMSWKFIQEKSGLENIKSKTVRKGNSREEHIKIMNFYRDNIHKVDWRNQNGAPEKKNIVLDWKKSHPNGKKADCIKDTGLSKPTVYKWW